MNFYLKFKLLGELEKIEEEAKILKESNKTNPPKTIDEVIELKEKCGVLEGKASMLRTVYNILFETESDQDETQQCAEV